MSNKQTITTIALTGAILLSLGGGVFFGLFSCGGYMWHQQLFLTVFLLFLLAFLVFPPAAFKHIFSKGLILILLIGSFFVVRAGASTFYPSAPESMQEFIEGFILGVKYGPC
jgi:hypothetical protein